METNFSSTPSKKPYQDSSDYSNKTDPKESSIYPESKIAKKDPFSIQETKLSNLDSETTETVEKTSSTALTIIQQPQNKGEVLKKLQKKIEQAYSSYKEKQPELAKKAKESLTHFISTIEKHEITISKESSEFQHFKENATGLKLEYYPDTKGNYALLKVFVGKGGQKTVKMSVDLSTFEPVVRSSIDVTKDREKTSAENEIKIQSLVSGPEFVKILASCSYVGKNLIPKIGVIMEYCNGGDLRTFADNHFGDNSPQIQDIYWRFMATLLSGLKKMAEKNIHHGDLKPENFMIKIDESDEKHLKITDFGYANIIEERMIDAETGRGTPDYLPPEFYEGLQLLNKGYGLLKVEDDEVLSEELIAQAEEFIAQGSKILINTKADLWAMGVILLELRTAFVASMDVLLDAEEYDIVLKTKELTQDKVDKLFSKDLNAEGEIKSIEDLNYRLLQVNADKRILPQDAWEAFQKLEKTNSNFCVSKEVLEAWTENPPILVESKIEEEGEEEL